MKRAFFGYCANVLLRVCIHWPLHRQEAASISKTSDLKVLHASDNSVDFVNLQDQNIKKNSFLQIASQKYPLFLYKLL